MSFNSIGNDREEWIEELERQRIENMQRMNTQIKEDAKKLGVCEKVLHCIRHGL